MQHYVTDIVVHYQLIVVEMDINHFVIGQDVIPPDFLAQIIIIVFGSFVLRHTLKGYRQQPQTLIFIHTKSSDLKEN